MKKYYKRKIAVIGSGYWGSIIINTLYQIGINEITVYDINRKNLNIAKKNFKKIKIEKNFKNILENNSLKDIFVATPPSQNYKIVKDLVKNNKNIFLEKPGFKNLSQLNKINKIFNKKNKFMFGYVYCYNDYIKKIKDIINKKYLGNILYVSLRRQNLGPIRNDVDVNYDLTSHDLSIIIKLFNKAPKIISKKKYFLLKNDIADISTIHLKLNKISIDINNSWLNPTKERLIKVIGSKKMLIYDEMNLESPLKIYNQYAKYPKLDFFDKKFFGSKVLIYKGSSEVVKVKVRPPLQNEILSFLKFKKTYTNINFGKKILSILKRI